MITGIWGKKIGMTQVFSDNNTVVPVTVIDTSNWVITQVKTKDRDGYNSIQLGLVRDEYAGQEFAATWLAAPKKHFSVLREVSLDEVQGLAVGQRADVAAILAQGDKVDVTGISYGHGFQGVMKRHGFSGGRASHGSKLGRKPGSLSFMRRQGRVIKGKKMPGNMGNEQCVIKNLKVIRIEPAAHVLLLKGAVPGKTGSFVFVRKRG